MKNNQNDQRYEDYSRDQSNHKSHDDFNILDPNPNSEMLYLGDDDNDLADQIFMNSSDYQDYDE